MTMKKTVWALAGLLALGALVAGCSGEKKEAAQSSDKKVVLKVGATPVPHAEILNEIKPLLAKDGIDLQIIEFTDYVKPNLSLNDKEIDANFFQHEPYLKKFAADRKLDLVNLVAVHIEPMGVYSKKLKDIKSVPDGAKVAIPNDPTNGGRALNILAKAGLIKLKDGVGISATVGDIVENPKNLKIKTLDAAQLARSVDTVDVALVPGNFAWTAGLKPAEALATEQQDEGVINVFVVNTKDVDSDFGKAVKKLLTSQEFKNAIAKSDFKDFGKPTTW